MKWYCILFCVIWRRSLVAFIGTTLNALLTALAACAAATAGLESAQTATDRRASCDGRAGSFVSAAIRIATIILLRWWVAARLLRLVAHLLRSCDTDELSERRQHTSFQDSRK